MYHVYKEANFNLRTVNRFWTDIQETVLSLFLLGAYIIINRVDLPWVEVGSTFPKPCMKFCNSNLKTCCMPKNINNFKYSSIFR